MSHRSEDRLVRLTHALTVLALLLLPLSPALSAQTITEYPIPTPESDTYGITAGPDGNVWFAESTPRKIGRITPEGTVTEFPLPPDADNVMSLTTAPDGNLWFLTSSKVGRMTSSGNLSFFPLPPQMGVTNGWSITSGPDGSLWYVDPNNHLVGRIALDGTVTQFAVPVPSGRNEGGPYAITPGPDGNLWYSMFVGNSIGRITTQGTETNYPIPGVPSGPLGIANGPDGALWFTTTDMYANSIGRLTTAGDFQLFAIPTATAMAYDIAAGPDGNLWFTESLANKIARITPGGEITEYSIPTPASGPKRIVSGPDGALWFVEYGANKIGRLVPGGAPPPPTCTPDTHTLCLVGGRFSVKATFQPTPTGPSFEAHAVPFTDHSGYFWFFDASNVEIVVKVLNACVDPFDSYWVFAAGLTNVAVVMTVTDTLTGATRQYENALGTPFAPIQDTKAFSTCP